MNLFDFLYKITKIKKKNQLHGILYIIYKASSETQKNLVDDLLNDQIINNILFLIKNNENNQRL